MLLRQRCSPVLLELSRKLSEGQPVWWRFPDQKVIDVQAPARQPVSPNPNYFVSFRYLLIVDGVPVVSSVLAGQYQVLHVLLLVDIRQLL